MRMSIHRKTALPICRFLPGLVAGLWLIACGGSGTSPTDPIDAAGDAGANTAPSAVIDSPTADQMVTSDQSVDFVGKAYDAEDTPTMLTAEWTSNWQGLLHSGMVNAVGTTTFTADNLEAGTHMITLTITDSKGLKGEATISLNVVASEPVLLVTIEPKEPTTTDILTAKLQTAVEDDVTVLYQWLRDGEDSGYEGDTLIASATTKSEQWTVTAAAVETGGFGEATVTILNSVPTCTQVTLLPQAAPSDEARVCTCTQWSDEDTADTSQDTCVFTDTSPEAAGDGTVGADETDDESCTLQPSSIAKGMKVVCALTPHDGEAAGTPIDSDSSSVMNSAPTEATNAAISFVGDEATIESVLTCTYEKTAADSDGDEIAYQVSWVVDEVEYPGTQDMVVLGSLDLSACAECPVATVGSAVQCRVRACEVAGTSACSAPINSAAIVLGNLPPTGGSALLVATPPAKITEASTLTCMATGAQDPEGTEITWTYAWEIKPMGADAYATVADATESTLTGADFDKGDTVRCVVTPVDADGGTGDPVTSKLPNPVISNSAPAVTDVSLQPQQPVRTDTLVCAFTGQDPDAADTLSMTVEWHKTDATGQASMVSSEVVQDVTQATMAASVLDPGESVWCSVTPSDGDESGDAQPSASVTVINQAPTAPVVALELPDPIPLSSEWAGDVACTVVTPATDADGDTLTLELTLTINGAAVVDQDGTVSAAAIDHCDTITCVATADDGWADGKVSSNTAKGQLPAGMDCPVDGFCHLPTCLDAGGCGPSFYDEMACDDGLFCTGEEFCDPEQGCIYGTPPQEDNNPCTVDTCYEAGEGVPGGQGCAAAAEGTVCNFPDAASETPCDDGDPCTPNDVCISGQCVALADNICIEEPLSIGTADQRSPSIGHVGQGRYVTQWVDTALGTTFFRATDGNDSRVNEQTEIQQGEVRHRIETRIPALPGGRYLTMSVGYFPVDGTIFYQPQVTLRKHSFSGKLEAQAEFNTGIKAQYKYLPENFIPHMRLIPLTWPEVDPTAMGLVKSDGLSYAAVDPSDLTVGPFQSLITKATGSSTMTWNYGRHFDARPIVTYATDGSPQRRFVAVWTRMGNSQYAQRVYIDWYDASGAPIENWPDSAVVTQLDCSGGCINFGALHVDWSIRAGDVRLVVLPNGDSVVLWEEVVVADNTAIRGRLIGADGSYLSDVFNMLPPAQAGGHQTLGGVDLFSDGRVIVTFTDDSDVAKGMQARSWIFDPYNPTPPSLDVALHADGFGDQRDPVVTVIPGQSGTGEDDEYVVALVNNGAIWTRRLQYNGTTSQGLPQLRANVLYAADQQQAAGASARTNALVPPNVLVVHDTASTTSNKHGIRGRLFNTQGEQVLPEWSISKGVFHADEVAVSSGENRFIVTYTRRFAPGEDGDIKARIYNAAGVELTPGNGAVTINAETDKHQYGAATAVDKTGQVLAVWTGDQFDGNDTVYGRFFNLELDALTDDFVINTKDSKRQWQAAVAAHPTKPRYAVAWTSNQAANRDVYLRMVGYNAATNEPTFLTDDVAVNTGMGQQEMPSVAVAANGDVVVCYQWTGYQSDGDGDVVCKHYQWVEGVLYPSGNEPLAVAVLADTAQGAPQVMFVTEQDFVVAYESDGVDWDMRGIQLRRFNTDGFVKPVDPRTVINRVWDAEQTRPFLIDASAGAYWVGWDSNHNADGDKDVYFRVFPKY